MTTKKDLKSIFYPKSVAMVGASNTFGKWGNITYTNLIAGGYKGKIYPINPKDEYVAKIKSYPSLKDVPEPIDLVVIATPANTVADIFKEMKEIGCKGAVVISSGFSEVNEEGKKLEDELIKLAEDGGFAFVGPNTMGISNTHNDMYITAVHARLKKGGVSLIAQSGNLGNQLISWAAAEGIAVGIFCGSGNEAHISCEDYLDFLVEDENTNTILFYMEGVKDGRKFLEKAAESATKKPIIILKGGKTELGGRAAKSHTGAMAGNAAMYKAMCAQTGLVWASTSPELLNLSAAFSNIPLPKGNRVGITTLGGGWGVVTSDACSDYGLEIPPLPKSIVDVIDKVLPPYWNRNNPVDLVGTTDTTAHLTALEEMAKWKDVDAVITLGVLGRSKLIQDMVTSGLKTMDESYHDFLNMVMPQITEYEEYYRKFIIELMTKYEKPIIAVSLTEISGKTVFGDCKAKYKGVHYQNPEQAVMVLAKMYQYYKFLQDKKR